MQSKLQKVSKRPIDYVYWFRKCLRTHDNEGLALAEKHENLLNVFIIDPSYWEKCDISENRMNFLLDSLKDIDNSLRKMGSRLILLKGEPIKVMKRLTPEIGTLAFEQDTEPYALNRDE